MHRIAVRAEFVTPAFVGGSEPEHARLSATGIRGQLRWWLRAIAGGRTSGNLAETRRLEEQAFGSTDRRSALRIVLTDVPSPTRNTIHSPPLSAEDIVAAANTPQPQRLAAADRVRLTRGNPQGTPTNTLAYLGYGAMNYHGEATREYFPAASPWAMLIQSRELDSSMQELVNDALWAWVHLGSIGTRSRRGFGSIRCTEITPADSNLQLLDTGVDKFRESARGFLARNAAQTASTAAWSYFTPSSSILISTEAFPTWQKAMSKVGAWMIAFRRRYGIGSDERTQLRGRDYTWLKAAGIPAGIPDRAGFGLPLPFDKPEEMIVSWGRDGRRASPLLIRISSFGGQFHPVLTHLPAALTPGGEQLHFRSRASGVTPQQRSIVHDFLAQLEERKVVTPV